MTINVTDGLKIKHSCATRIQSCVYA